MSDTFAVDLHERGPAATSAPPRRLGRPRRRPLRMKARIEAHEQELLRRQQTALSLACEARELRAALASALAERAQLERALAQLSAERAREAAEAGKLAEAVLDQQAAVRELELAVAVVLAGRV